MNYEIENEFIKVVVNTLGAEPMSIRSQKDGLEYLWQGNPKYWSRRSPTLFPIVGMLEEDRYSLDGQEYEMELHGFAKTSEFELVEKNFDSMTFRLTDNEDSLKKYPFRFELYTYYKLEGNFLSVAHKVVNKEEKSLWFSIGEHPGFNCPLLGGETMEDYSLVFNEKESVNRRFLENGLLSGEEEPFLENEAEIGLSHDLFKRLAIILQGLKSKSVTLQSCKHERKVTVTFESYPYLGLWSPDTGAPFVCIEPWYGITSIKGREQEITRKEGMILLEPMQEFNCRYGICIQ